MFLTAEFAKDYAEFAKDYAEFAKLKSKTEAALLCVSLAFIVQQVFNSLINVGLN